MPQRKKPQRKKPITVGKRTSYSTGKRPVSARPSQASKVRAAKKTTSSKYRARRSSVSKAKVTRDDQRPMGRGRRDVFYKEKEARVTTGRGRSGPKLPKLPAKSKVTRGGSRKSRPAMPKESAARKAKRLANRAAKGYGSKAAGMVLRGAARRALGPLSAGLAVGRLMQRLSKNVSTSGRGAGRVAFNPPKPNKPKKKKR